MDRPPGTPIALLFARMLRITVTRRPHGPTLVLEGRLCGDWVDEVSACWQGLLATHAARSIRVDLDGVTFINAAGRALIRSMRAHGASLAATDVMRRTIGAVAPRGARKPAKRSLDG